MQRSAANLFSLKSISVSALFDIAKLKRNDTVIKTFLSCLEHFGKTVEDVDPSARAIVSILLLYKEGDKCECIEEMTIRYIGYGSIENERSYDSIISFIKLNVSFFESKSSEILSELEDTLRITSDIFVYQRFIRVMSSDNEYIRSFLSDYLVYFITEKAILEIQSTLPPDDGDSDDDDDNNDDDTGKDIIKLVFIFLEDIFQAGKLSK